MNSMSQSSVYVLIWRFKSGRTSVPEKAPSGHPTMLCTQDHTDGGNTLIWEEGRIAMYEVAEMLDISYGSAYAILHNESGSWKECTKWVPRQLNDPHKQHRMEVATQFCSNVKKIQAYRAALSLAMTCGCIILMLKARDKAGDGNILVTHEKRSSEAYLYQIILLTFLWYK